MTERPRKPNATCNVCKKAIYRRPGELQNKKRGVFCSQTCYGKSQRIEIPCTVCGTMILSGANKKTCSRACANKNRAGMMYKDRSKPRKDKVTTYRLQKKRLMQERGRCCERCGYEVYQILLVHHRDRNREHNDLANLELLCPNCHAKEHYLKKWKIW